MATRSGWLAQRRRGGIDIRQLPGSIGYVELIYAVQNQIPYGSVSEIPPGFL
jgi:hypothetical protein